MSYRREDSEGQAGRIYDDLVGAYGSDAVFMDVAGIAPGIDFRKAIDDNVSACGVFLAVIGPNWVSVTGENGERRLDDPDDFVRLEIASALARNIAVIPVLVHGSKMPHRDVLPDNIKDLAYRNSVEISHARWNSDVELLVGALKAYVTSTPSTANQPVHATVPVQLPPPITPYAAPEANKSKLPLIVGGSAAAVVLAAAIAFFAMHNPDKNKPVPGPTPSPTNPTVVPSPAPAPNGNSPLDGTWTNARVSDEENSLSQLKISGSGGQLTVEPAGECKPNPCSWGAQTLPFDGTQVTGTWQVRNLPKEARNNRSVQITIRANGSDLDVKAVNSASNPAGQVNQRPFDFRFVRAQ
jgi:hypothetical protein